MLCIHLVFGAALPLRAASKSLKIIFRKLPELHGYKSPCFSTVKRWAEKIGYYKLTMKRPGMDRWMLIADASIQMGDQKCLVILGCPSGKFPKGRPLTLKDLEILNVKITRKLTGEKIYNWLQEVRDKFGIIDSICSDRGPDMLCGIRQFLKKNIDTKHVVDTAHRAANFIKSRLEKDTQWRDFKQLVTQSRRTMQNSSVAGAIPPNLRVKARYMNIDLLVKWGSDMLHVLDNLDQFHDKKNEFIKYLNWMKEYREDISRWNELITVTKIAKQLVSKNGVHYDTHKKFKKELKEMRLSPEGNNFAEDMLNFFVSLSLEVSLDGIYVGSSEIIESLFGKLKYMERDQTSFGFTSLVLAAVASVGPLDRETVKQAIRTVRTEDIEKWSKEQVGTSVQSARKTLLNKIRMITKKVGTKLVGWS